MPYLPDYSTFVELARDHDRVPVTRRLLCDGLTPVSAFQRLDDGQTACLFESVVGGEKVGRYSFLAVGPVAEMTAYEQEVTVSSGTDQSTVTVENPIDEVRKRIGQHSVAKVPNQPPFTGGAVGFAAYDIVRYAEHLPNAPTDDRGIPDLFFAFYEQMVVFDNVTKTMTVLALANTDHGVDLESSFQDAIQRIDELIDRLKQPFDHELFADISTAGDPRLAYESNFSQEAFEDAVRRCVEYIKAGDIFQVVLSQRLKLEIDVDPFEIYRTLRIVNPSPFMFFLRTPQTTLVGSSPEIMCRVVDDTVTVRPLAGTRPRGKTDQEDLALEKELLADPKERAEHVMLVDLGRNDVGRVAEYGSVELPDVMIVERYSHVMHISSTVVGKLQPDLDAFDALAASLPAGTVSGAPKVRAMEIIDELEPHRRGPYAGAVGYVDFGGNMDTCIALRTLVIQGDKAYVQAGAGIVADSDPTTEYRETLNKARGLLKAIEVTHERCGGSQAKT